MGREKGVEDQDGYSGERWSVLNPLEAMNQRSQDSPPAPPLPASNVKPTTASLMSIGYLSLSRTISLNASATSFLTISGRPLLFIVSSASSPFDAAECRVGVIGEA